MKRFMILVCALALSQPVLASEIIPPRIVVKWLVNAVQDGRTNSVTHYYSFAVEKHKALTPLSRAEQLQLLRDLPIDELKFDKDEYADEGQRFVVQLVAPIRLDLEMERVQLTGEMGPPWKYVVIAIRKTAQPAAYSDSIRTPVPIQSGHPFRRGRTPIPMNPDTYGRKCGCAG